MRSSVFSTSMRTGPSPTFGVPVDVCQLLPIAAENNSGLKEGLAKDYCAAMRRVLNTEDSDWCLSAYQLDRSVAIDQILGEPKPRPPGLLSLA